MITDFEELCVICNKPAVDTHHCINGTANRRIADKADLTIPLCRQCHDDIHRNNKMLVMTKIIGQLAYEKQKVYEGMLPAEARIDFTELFGRSWL